MKRTLSLAALCLVASAAQAQSSVTVFGVLDANVYRKQLAGETARLTQSNGGLTSSYIGLRGNEDLGGGLRAAFMLSGFLNTDTGMGGRSPTDPLWSRAAWVGVGSDGAGMVRLGRQSAQAYQQLMRYSAFNDSTQFGPSALHNYIPAVAQPMMTGSGATDTGWSNAVSYASPSMGGLVAGAMVSIGESTTAGNRNSLSLNYQGQGPFAAGVVVEQIDRMNLNFSKPPADLPMSRSCLISAGTSYDFGVAKVFAQFIRTELDGTASHIVLKTSQLSAAVPLGQGRLLAAFGRTTKDQLATADQARETLSIAYSYFLSKRTDLYAAVMRDRVTALPSGTGSALGIRHRF